LLSSRRGGGDDAAVRDAFLKSGGMVVVQSGQSYVTKKYVDPAVAKTDAYCTSVCDGAVLADLFVSALLSQLIAHWLSLVKI
jgi:hypothetical protein